MTSDGSASIPGRRSDHASRCDTRSRIGNRQPRHHESMIAGGPVQIARTRSGPSFNISQVSDAASAKQAPHDSVVHPRAGLGDGDVGGAEGGVPGGVVLGGGAVVGAGLEQVRQGDEVVEHGLVGGAVGGGKQGGVGEDGAGLGGDGAGGGFEDQVVGGGGGLVFDDQGAGQGVDVLVEGDLGLAAGGGEPAQGGVGGQGVGGGGGRGPGGGGGGVVGGEAAAGEEGDGGECAGEAGELHVVLRCGCRFVAGGFSLCGGGSGAVCRTVAGR